MTYAGFLLLFLLLPLGILAVFLRQRLLDRRYLIVVGVLTLVALMYMAPWDHFAAIWGLWVWKNNRTWGFRWWAIPPEEYLFCVLEALLAITLTFAVLTRKDAQSNIRITTPQGRVSLGDASVPAPPGKASLGNANITTPPGRVSLGDASVPKPNSTPPPPLRGMREQMRRWSRDAFDIFAILARLGTSSNCGAVVGGRSISLV